jgi:hypothetical protein
MFYLNLFEGIFYSSVKKPKRREWSTGPNGTSRAKHEGNEGTKG